MCRSASQGGRRCPGSHSTTPTTPAAPSTHTDADGTTWETHTFPDGSTGRREVFDNSRFIAQWEKNEAAQQAAGTAHDESTDPHPSETTTPTHARTTDPGEPERESGRQSRWATHGVVNYAGGNDVVGQQIGHIGHRPTTTGSTGGAGASGRARPAKSRSWDDVPAEHGTSSEAGPVINLRLGNAWVGEQIDSIDVQELS